MAATLIGSRAARMWFPDFREPNGDWDWHASEPQEGWEPLDICDMRHDLFVDSRLAQWNWGSIATPDELYTMKISHGYWDINGSWDKHAADIVFFQRKGCKFIPELHDILLEIWKDRYPKNKISLDKTAAEFFTDHVVKKYVHDTVHESVAYGDVAAYTKILKDGSEVLVDNDKFWVMPLDEQLDLVREELYVIALERVLIPKDYKGSPGLAYKWALKRTAVSLFKNAWATFLLLHLDELWRPDVDFVKRHRDNADKLVLMEDA